MRSSSPISLMSVNSSLNLFDQYRVNKLKVMIVPNFTGLDGGFLPFGNNPDPSVFAKATIWHHGLPNIHSVIDYDSAATNNLNQLMQHSTYRMTRGNRIHSRYWTPAISLGTNCTTGQNSVTEPTAQKFKQWLGTDSTCVPHYGIKLLIDPGPYVQNHFDNPAINAPYADGTAYPLLELKCRVYVTAYIECKGVR